MKNDNNVDLIIRLMVELSNNSRLTQETALKLAESLSEEDFQELIRWLRHALSFK